MKESVDSWMQVRFNWSYIQQSYENKAIIRRFDETILGFVLNHYFVEKASKFNIKELKQSIASLEKQLESIIVISNLKGNFSKWVEIINDRIDDLKAEDLAETFERIADLRNEVS